MDPIFLRPLLLSLIAVHERQHPDAHFSKRRWHDLQGQLLKMGWTVASGPSTTRISARGRQALSCVKKQDWNALNALLLHDVKEYSTVYRILSRNRDHMGYTIAQICCRGREIELNRVICESCLDWGIRLRTIQRNLFTKGDSARFYLLSPRISSRHFMHSVVSAYKTLNSRSKALARFVSIAELRETVCENNRMSRGRFDEMFGDTIKKEPGSLELTSSPVTSQARRAPLIDQYVTVDSSSTILSPQLDSSVLEGFRFRDRLYDMVAIRP